MKLPNLFTRKKLRATTARRSLGLPDEMDYEEMSEPNMKLSRALLIVLVLHVVAVAGIIAFNTIKSRQGSFPLVSTAKANTNATQAPTVKSNAPAVASSDTASTRRDETNSSRTTTKPAAKDEKKTDRPKAESTTKAAAPKTYTVAKGDNPVSIAKKFKVPYDQLLAANHIDDPHKLQIGQKLIIPTKTVKPKKGE